jgi:LysR family glycine cleavage system transcriptional activator
MRLPSMNALRAFEAAARHQSFKRAGDELHVSSGAVSRFVKLLEDEISVQLFERKPNGIALTGEGRALCKRLSKAFADMESAVHMVQRSSKEIKILLPVTLGSRLIVQKISSYNESRTSGKVTYSVEFVDWDDFQKSDYDLGVFCDAVLKVERSPPGLEFMPLRSEALTPVCSPSLLKKSGDLKTPKDLLGVELLHSEPTRSDWGHWLKAVGASDVDWRNSGQTFLSTEGSVRAAIDGLGVAIADLTLFERELREGALVTPFDFVLRENTGYSICIWSDRLALPDVTEFIDWLIRETGNLDRANT